jgi:hypothetical protein
MCAPLDRANAYTVSGTTDIVGALAPLEIRGSDLLPGGCPEGQLVAVVVAWVKGSGVEVVPRVAQIRKLGEAVAVRVPIGLGTTDLAVRDLYTAPCFLGFEREDSLTLDLDSSVVDVATGSPVQTSFTFLLYVNPVNG